MTIIGATGAQVLPGAGLASLTSGEGPSSVAAFVDFAGKNPAGRLNLTVYANGREWLSEPSRLWRDDRAYTRWAASPAAHNTLVLDGKGFPDAPGTIVNHYPVAFNAGQWTVSADTGPRCAVKRNLELQGKVLVDIFEVKCPAGTVADWVSHSVAASLLPVGDVGPAGNESPGKTAGYEFLSDIKSCKPAGATRWEFAEDPASKQSRRLGIWFLDSGGETIYTAKCPGTGPGDAALCLIRRRISRGEPMSFVTVYDLSGDGTSVKKVDWLYDSSAVSRVSGGPVPPPPVFPQNIVTVNGVPFNMDRIHYARVGANLGF